MTPSPLVLPGRVHAAELMDGPDVDFATFQGCLRDLERVNVASFGYRPTLRWLDRILGDRRRLSVLDVGSGHGDMLRRIADWARRRGVEVELAGIDLSPWAARAAIAATPEDLPIRYLTGDVFALPETERADVVISALFTHHLGDADLVRFVRWMQDRAGLGWFVNDLHRHAVAYHGLRAIFGVLPLHPFVVHDGPVSVRRSLDRDDWQRVIAAAGLDPATVDVRWQFPFRWAVGTRG